MSAATVRLSLLLALIACWTGSTRAQDTLCRITPDDPDGDCISGEASKSLQPASTQAHDAACPLPPRRPHYRATATPQRQRRLQPHCRAEEPIAAVASAPASHYLVAHSRYATAPTSPAVTTPRAEEPSRRLAPAPVEEPPLSRPPLPPPQPPRAVAKEAPHPLALQ